MTLHVTAAGVTAPALLLLRVDLAQTSNLATFPGAGVVVSGGLPGAWTGRLVYLCDTLADALALAAVYAGAQPATITGHDADLDAWPHMMSDDPSITQDGTLNGVPAPYLVTVPVTMAAR